MSKLDAKQIQHVIKVETEKCREDVTYMLKKYAIIEHPTRGRINFNLYPFQEDTLHQFNNNRINIVGKSRQMGISTLCAGHVVHRIIFREAYSVLIIATTQKVAQELMKKVKIMYDKLPSWLKKDAQKTYDNATELTLSNGSTVSALSSAPNASRSKALSLLIIDEAAFIPTFRDIWTASQMTLSTGGDAIILSTPNGASGLFYQLWTQAISGEIPEGLEKFNAIKLKWDLHPERDQQWRDQQTYILGSERAAKQECDIDFSAASNSVIESEDLQWYNENVVKDPLEKRGVNQDYWLWAYPDYSKNYIVSVDVARGDASDNSAIQVIDVESCEQVAEWSGKVDPTQLGYMAVEIATSWNMALLVIENANVGWTTVQEAINLNYSNIYYTYRQDPYVDPSIHIAKNYDLKDKQDMVPGHTTSPRSRPVMIGKLQIALSNSQRYFIYHSERLHHELSTFRWINGKAQAQEGHKDDLVMATAIGLYVIETALKLRNQGIALNKMALSNIKKVVYKPKATTTYYTQRINGINHDLKWLL